MEITEEQKDAIDNEIRERILAEREAPENLPVSAMVFARASLGLGINLEKACPYMRACEYKAPSFCLDQPYRQCPYYQINLASEIMDGKLESLADLC